ncbi:MAG: hypothetical protein RLZZ385_179 [Pseudomonadota bacterium]|jgi:alkylated DNA repair dioxygenase AlkB
MHTDLFQHEPRPELSTPRVYDLPDGSLLEFPQALTAREADDLFARLREALPWEQAHIRIAGRVLPIPRLQCWIGDPDTSYGYSGIRMQPLPWPDCLSDVRHLVKRLAGQDFNSVLANYYRTGQDSVSWHSDNEPEMGPMAVVASLSLGATRTFELRHKTRRELGKKSLPLQHGSLLIMGEGTQNNWLHQVPKEKHVDGSRINLTFRRIVS